MNILIEIGHPAHVHFFRPSLSLLEERGHRVQIVTRAKEITNDLLERMRIPYVCLSRPAAGRGKLGLALELGSRWAQIGRMIHARKIDLAASISGISTSLPARLCRVRSVVFTDTEDAALSNRIAFPFADRIYTPRFFLGELGPKHRRYDGLHELAYLQDFDFPRAAAVRRQLGLPERYSIIRVIANDALHDQDILGISVEQLARMIAFLERAGKVYVTSQAPLPPALAAYRLQTPIEDVHAVLAGAQLFLGESPTMAVESSLLGTPAYLISGRVGRLGNMIGLERERALLRCFPDWASAEQALPRLEELPALKREWSARARSYADSTVRMREFVVGALLGNGEGGA